jgi:hypothetical protein
MECPSVPVPLNPSTEDETSLIFRNALAARTAAIAIINGPLYRLGWRIIQGIQGCLFQQLHPFLLPSLKQPACQTNLPEKSSVTHKSIMQFIHALELFAHLPQIITQKLHELFAEFGRVGVGLRKEHEKVGT